MSKKKKRKIEWETLDGTVVQNTGPNGDEWGFKLRRLNGSEPVILLEDEMYRMLAFILMQKQNVLYTFAAAAEAAHEGRSAPPSI